MKKKQTIIEVEATDLEGNSYKCPIKIGCLHKFLSAEENWEAIYDLIIIIQKLNKNSLIIEKDNNGFVKEVQFSSVIITDEIINFAFKNIWNFVEIKAKTNISDEIIIKTRREQLKEFIEGQKENV
ncbi:MAG: hypothetical protein WC917_03895 [Bacilli bacterium]|jgi:hypothetical protein